MKSGDAAYQQGKHNPALSFLPDFLGTEASTLHVDSEHAFTPGVTAAKNLQHANNSAHCSTLAYYNIWKQLSFYLPC